MPASGKPRARVGAELFDRLADPYGRVEFFPLLGAQLIAWSGMQAGDHVLDVATGRGAHLSSLRSAIGPTGSIVAVDLAPRMVALTRRAERESDVLFLLADAAALPFPSAAFDGVVCGFAVHIFSNPAIAIAEMFRVLRPGGSFAFSLPRRASGGRWQFFEDLLNRYLFGGSALHAESLNSGMAPFLEQVGFENVEETVAEVHVPFGSPEEFWEMESSHGIRGHFERLAPSALEGLKAELFAHLRQMELQGGIVLDRGARFVRARKRNALLGAAG